MKPDFEKEAKKYCDNHWHDNNDFKSFLAGCEYAYSIDKETIERLEKEKKRLEDWKDEMITLTTPLLDWGQSKESGIRPGHSIFEEALKRSKEYPKLQELEKEKEQLHEIIELNRDTILNWQEVDVMNKRLISDLRKELKEYRGRVW